MLCILLFDMAYRVLREDFLRCRAFAREPLVHWQVSGILGISFKNIGNVFEVVSQPHSLRKCRRKRVFSSKCDAVATPEPASGKRYKE